MAIADDLERVSLFSDLSDRQLRQLSKLFHDHPVPAGTTLVNEGKMSGISFFVVAEGLASVTVGGSEVARIGPGDYFGELALIAERERAATVTAETAMRCVEAPLWDLREFLHQNPDVMWKLLQHVVEMLAPEHPTTASGA